MSLGTDLLTGGLPVVGGLISGLITNGQSQSNWDKQQMYNLPVNQVKRLEDAGLNPQMMLGQISPGIATSAPEVGPAAQQVTAGIETGAQMFSTSMQRRLIAAQVKKAEADAVYAQNMAAKTAGIDTDYEKGQLSYLNGPQTQLTTYQGFESAARKSLIDAETTNTNEDTVKKTFEEQNLAANTNLTNTQQKLVQNDVDTYYAKFNMEMREALSRVGLNNASSVAAYASAAKSRADALYSHLQSNLINLSPAQAKQYVSAFLSKAQSEAQSIGLDVNLKGIDAKWSDKEHHVGYDINRTARNFGYFSFGNRKADWWNRTIQGYIPFVSGAGSAASGGSQLYKAVK